MPNDKFKVDQCEIKLGAGVSKLPDSTDILIVGAGPVGMTVANLLASYGVKALVLDREQSILEHPRAIGTDNDGLRVMQAAGLARDASFS